MSAPAGLGSCSAAGHGPEPGVFALRLKHLLAAALAHGRPPGAALEWTARRLGDTGELFATVFVALVDVEADVLCYANAGHPAALLLARSPGRPEPLQPGERHGVVPPRSDGTPLTRLDLAATGPLLSTLVASWSWATLEHRFTAGDLLLAFTDGLIEERTADGEQFGVDRLVDIAAGFAGRPLDQLLDELFDEVRRFRGRHERR